MSQTPQQNATTTPPPVDCNANPNDPSCPQQNVDNNPNQPQEQQPQQHTQTCPDGSVIDVSATCPSTTNNNQSADNGNVTAIMVVLIRQMIRQVLPRIIITTNLP
ncbi:MAG: hypothetical protein WBE68_22695 [Candidatus Nitrosopolaris sp.]